MKTISDLSDDLIGEILSKVPVSSLSALRSTCRKWNDLSRIEVFGKKAVRNQQFLGFMLVNYKVYSLRFSLQGICNKDELFVDPSLKKIHELEDVSVSRISQCDGLLLCVNEDHSQLLIWNPYLGQTRWIQPTKTSLMRYNSYALGYDDNKNYKIVRFLYNHWKSKDKQIEVYDFSSNSWRFLNVNPDWEEPSYLTGVSLKGNTYFLGRKVTRIEDHLLCFDFETESFGPRLLLPYKPLGHIFASVTLSCVRDEKLALLYHHDETFDTIKIWISNKIDEPNAVSWSIFFKVDGNNLPRGFPYYFENGSFFIDEEKKVAVHSPKRVLEEADRRPCIIGEDRFIKYVDIGEGMKNHLDYGNLFGSSYVPSLVQLKLDQL